MKSNFKAFICFFISFFLFGIHSNAQNNNKQFYSLEQCIEIALNNNFVLLQNQARLYQSNENLLQSKSAHLPTLNGNGNYAYNFGRRIDPFTNQFAESRVLSQNYSLSSNFNIFNGFSTVNNTKAALSDVQANISGLERTSNDVALNIAENFLQVLVNTELYEFNSQFLLLSRSQVERTKQLYEAGRVPRGELLQAEAQLANDELNMVQSKNALELAYLTLAQSMGLNDAESFEVIKPDFSVVAIEMISNNAKTVYEKALEGQPSIKQAEYQLRASDYFYKSAKGRRSPSISMFGAIGTGYSELARRQIGSTTVNQFIGTINGQDIFIDVPTPIFEQTPFRDQLDQNFNRTIGFTLSIPIFNALQTRNSISTARVNREITRLQLEIEKQQLQRSVYTAYLEAKTSYERYKFSEKLQNANKEAFEYIQQRFDVGIVNAVELNISKNQMSRSAADLIIAKYQFIMRTKVLDFYMGKPLSF